MGYAQYYSIVMRTTLNCITLHTIHVGALENSAKSNNITTLLTELKKAIGVMKRTNVTISFSYIRTSKSAYYLLYDRSHSKTNTTIIPYSILLQILASQAKK